MGLPWLKLEKFSDFRREYLAVIITNAIVLEMSVCYKMNQIVLILHKINSYSVKCRPSALAFSKHVRDVK